LIFQQLTVSASLHAISAINWFVARRLEGQLSDSRSTTGTGQIDAVHLAGGAWAAAHAATHTATTGLTEGAIAFTAIHGSVARWLKRQL